MNKKLIITFGCSWTYGVGAGYQPGQTANEYKAIAWDSSICDTKSFRGILSKRFALDNKNFAHGGSSNQAQFNYAKRYFGGIDFVQDHQKYEKIVVLHAITSTARNVFFNLESKSELHFKYNEICKFGTFMVKNSYDHDYEVQQLEYEMNFWNVFYKSVGINNIWVDTFNHHNYNHPIENMIDTGNRDLLSQLCIRNNINNFDKNYHHSNWNTDSNRVDFLIKNGLLNPISKHPTEKGHVEIADLIAPTLQSML